MGSALNSAWGAPYDIATGTTVATYANVTLDADGEYIATVMFVPGEAGTTDTPTHVGYRQGTLTGTPTNAYDIGVMALDASGNPDGTFIFSAQFTPVVGNNGKFIWVAVTGSALTAGTAYALVLKANSSASTSHFITATNITPMLVRIATPYGVTNVTGSAVKSSANYPAMAMKSATKVYGLPASSMFTANVYGGSGVEAAILFNVPTQFCSTYKVAGIRLLDLTGGSVADTYTMTLYSDPTGTPSLLNQAPLTDADVVSVAGGGLRVMEFTFDGTLDALNAGTTYAIGLAKDDASDGTVYTIEVETQADFEGWRYGAQTWYGSRNPAAYPPATGTPAFTETLTKRPFAELILADLTPPAGGSGGNANILRGSVIA